MKSRGFVFSLLSLLLVAIGTITPVHAQENSAAVAEERPLTREQRLRQHEERVRRIIDERRKARLAEQKGETVEVNLTEEERKMAGMPPAGASVAADVEEEKLDPGQVPFGTMIFLITFRTNEETTQEQLDAVVRQNERFVSEIRLRNDASVPFDRIRLALKYDKRFVKPLRVFDNEVRAHASAPPVFERNDRDSVLVYEVAFDEPRHTKDLPVLSIVWEAVVPTEYTGLSFRFASGDTEAAEHTAVYYQGRNVLGDERDPLDGALSGSLLILKPFKPDGESQADILQGKKEELYELYLSGVGKSAPAGLHLVGPEEPPVVGEDFFVDVQLANPGGSVIDALSFFITFDPDILQVIDDDRGNWIKRGINVHDGRYRLDYPFDYHKRNEVDNLRGYISYAMSLGSALTLPSGTFARIRFHAIKPSGLTSIGLIQTRQGTGNLTSLRSFGFELFSSDPKLTVPLVEIPVLPEPLSQTVASVEGEQSPDSRHRQDLPAFLFDPRLLN